jgi:hypothetical protein
MRLVVPARRLKFRNDEFELPPRVRFVWHPIWFYFIWSEVEAYGNDWWGQLKSPKFKVQGPKSGRELATEAPVPDAAACQ